MGAAERRLGGEAERQEETRGGGAFYFTFYRMTDFFTNIMLLFNVIIYFIYYTA